MSKELIKKFLISFNEGKAQEAKKYLSVVIKEKLDLATKEAESMLEAKKPKKKVKKQPTHMGKPSMMKPKLLKFSKKIKENIDGERTKFTVKAQEGKVPTDIHLQHFTDILKENNIDVRFNEDTKNYCVPSEQFEETKTLLSEVGYEVTPVISMEDTNNDELEKDIDNNVDEEDIDMVDKEGGTYQSDRTDKLRQSISDIRNKMNI